MKNKGKKEIVCAAAEKMQLLMPAAVWLDVEPLPFDVVLYFDAGTGASDVRIWEMRLTTGGLCKSQSLS